VGYEALKDMVAKWPPGRAAKIAEVPEERLREAAAILGEVLSISV
jgi:anaerobic selenocysteine-containing dehydrogenase